MKRLLSLLTLSAVLVPASSAMAQRSGLNIHAIFESGRTSGFTVGEPLDVSYRKGDVRDTTICWSPAPVDRPACSKSFGAPRRAGKQRFTITLSNGRKIHATRTIRAAARKVPVTAEQIRASTHPVPFHAKGRCGIFGNGGNGELQDRMGWTRKGDGAAAYYGEDGTLQVFVYRTLQAGFMAADCLVKGL